MQIEIKNVSYYYDKKSKIKALDDISFNVEKGDFIAIVGQTGAGKSTLVQMLNGLIVPSEGEIKILDEVINSKSNITKLAKLRKDVGLVFQFPEYQLFEETILKDVMFGPLNFGLNEDEARVASIKALKEVSIDESLFDTSPFDISGGQKRRVAIAGILASNPSILVFDEATVGLDPNGKKEIMNLIKKLNDQGKTIILVTHDMEVVSKYAKKVVVLKEGKVLKINTPEKIFNKNNLDNLSLDFPEFYRFKNLLKKYKFKYDVSKIESVDELIDLIVKGVKHD